MGLNISQHNPIKDPSHGWLAAFRDPPASYLSHLVSLKQALSNKKECNIRQRHENAHCGGLAPHKLKAPSPELWFYADWPPPHVESRRIETPDLIMLQSERVSSKNHIDSSASLAMLTISLQETVLIISNSPYRTTGTNTKHLLRNWTYFTFICWFIHLQTRIH